MEDYRGDNMFKNAKVGDKVWDFIYGWGTIVEVYDITKFIYPIEVKFDNDKIISYTLDGKQNDTNIYPRLFWDEIKFEIPEKPFNLENELRKLEIIEFKFGKNNYSLIWNNKYNIIDFNCLISDQAPLTLYFTRESILNFLKNIDEKNITKEQFLIAYEKVFGRKIIYDRSVN